MAAPVARRIASLTLQQVRAIATGQAQHLTVRTEQDVEFWGDLIIACQGAEGPAMAALRRQAKLLFCGELVHDR